MNMSYHHLYILRNEKGVVYAGPDGKEVTRFITAPKDLQPQQSVYYSLWTMIIAGDITSIVKEKCMVTRNGSQWLQGERQVINGVYIEDLERLVQKDGKI